MPKPSSVDAVVGEAVRRHRHRRAWSEGRLATSLGLSEAEVVAIEAGRRRLAAQEAYDSVRALGIAVRDLYTGLDGGEGSESNTLQP